MNAKNILKFSISLVVTILLLWFVLKGIDLHKLWENIKKANYFWVLLSSGLALIAHWSRAYRWKLVLEPLGYKPSSFRCMLAVLIGYLTNLLLPRAGELARAASLQNMEKVPFEKSFGAVIAERIIDVFILLVLIALNLALEFDRLKNFFLDLLGDKFSNPAILISIPLIALAIGWVTLRWVQKNDARLSENAIYAKIKKLILGLWDGFSSVARLKKPWTFVGHTVLIWTMYYLMTWVLCFALPQTAGLGPLAALTILVMGSIGMAAPTVGGIGSYHFFVGKIVGLYGLSPQDGITLATFMHTMQGIIFVILFGLMALAISFFIQRKSQLSSDLSAD